MDIEIDGKGLTLVNLYGPNEDSPEFYIKLAEILEEYNNDTNILCGDFNLVQDQYLDTYYYVNIKIRKLKIMF